VGIAGEGKHYWDGLGKALSLRENLRAVRNPNPQIIFKTRRLKRGRKRLEEWQMESERGDSRIVEVAGRRENVNEKTVQIRERQ